MKQIGRILVIRFSSLGDIILLSPLFREAKKIFPKARVDFLTSTTFSSICANNNNINEIIQFDRSVGGGELARIRQLCVSNRYDLILDAHQSLRSRLLLTWLRGPFYRYHRGVACIDKRSLKRNLLLRTGINLLKNAVTQREAYCQLLSRFTQLQQMDTSTELFPGPAEQIRIKELISRYQMGDKNTIAIGSGSSFQGKSWPKEYYLELSEMLQNRGFAVVLLGSAGNTEPKFIFENSLKKPLNLSGDLSILESAELLKYCKLSISNDTAVAHMAEAMGTPAISIFGPTTKEFGYSPYLKESKRLELPLKCRPCSRNGSGECKNRIERQCLRDIPVKTVLESALQILKGHVTK